MKVPISKPYVDSVIEEKVIAVLRSGKYINGPEVKGFEAEAAAFSQAKAGAAVNSCTSALQLTLMALGVKAGDEVLVPSHTMFGSVEPILHLGAKPVFVDIDEHYTLDPADAQRKTSSATVGMVVVHLYGQPCDMAAIHEVAQRRGLWIVEDCAQAHGATYQGRPVGNLGRAGCFSFFPSKNATVAGDGGMVLSDDEALVAKVRSLREHGRASKNEHDSVGFNMRLSEIPASIGRVQLSRLDDFVAARNRIATRYNDAFKGLPLQLPAARVGARHGYHLYVVRTQTETERDSLQKHLAEKGVETGVHYPIPLHLQKAVHDRGVGLPKGSLPKTERAAATILSLPIFPLLTDAEQDHVIRAVQSFYGK